MAGHSKWANIKRKKEKTDAQKATAFTRVTREIIVATKAGGGDPDANFQLRLAIQNAKKANMPNDNISRAIKRGLGSTDGDQFEEIIYEGYGPNGVAFLVQTLSDNRNRTASEMRYIFSRNSGNLGETGCVSWLFEQKGIITVAKENINMNEEELFEFMLEIGADDVQLVEDYYEIITEVSELETVRNLLAEKTSIEEAGLSFIPNNTVEVSGETAVTLLKLVDALEEHDDVQNVYANFEISDEELEKLKTDL
jgi:YebC/PmpR family DNA-binding regulatory protein